MFFCYFPSLQGDSNTASTITSQTLENVYLADKDAAIPFSAGKQHYVLHFKDRTRSELMYQENLKHKTKREVRRRPRFVSTQDVAVKKRYLIFNSKRIPVCSENVGLDNSRSQLIEPDKAMCMCFLCSPTLVSTNSTAAEIPPYWDKSALPEYGYKVSLSNVLFCLIFMY